MNLIDALVLTHAGWSTESERKLYEAASEVVWSHAKKLKLDRQIEELQEQWAKLSESSGDTSQ